MKHTTKKQQTPPTPYHPELGKVGRDVDLSIGILIAENDEGGYEVLGPVSTINEGIEIAQHDYRRRLKEIGKGQEPMHVLVYKIWSRNYDGDYAIIFEMDGDPSL